MKTTTSIKLDTQVKESAGKLASELGVSLSGVVNILLKNFVQERRLVISAELELNDVTKLKYDEMLQDIEKGKNLSPAYSSVADLMESLSV